MLELFFTLYFSSNKMHLTAIIQGTRRNKLFFSTIHKVLLLLLLFFFFIITIIIISDSEHMTLDSRQLLRLSYLPLTILTVGRIKTS